MINYIKKLLGIFPDDWEFVETVNAHWKEDGTGIKTNVYYNIYFSESRCLFQITCYGYRSQEHSMYSLLNARYDAEEIKLKSKKRKT